MSNKILISTLFIIAYFNFGCSRYTDNPQNTVVKLRDGIVDLVEGRTNELTGNPTTGETFVFIDGYMSAPSDFRSLAVTPNLRNDLAQIVPHTERYVIARIRGDRIEEYTYFEQGWPRDPADKQSPIIIKSCPLLIEGDYKIRKEYNSDGQVVLKVEN